mmetsp:Transcript_16739/g.25295  ORF Transcript_16739/g.25295 Transcript_16739/m.25295 type:complete len:194 (+) Transcript_16739:101-682(+)|eukprot:CAMPEP_0178912976 /NCGR_PEP_ID=MMETSP0786-20121207/10577_1 /TAXON_ID=186022 /ORGANISM="Thalassionema frauenfeldii, Strain CCMP 1798" /LENGTH=193 /DNA_ID=CAMNT_0020585649 /DNA_START=283 /DNA_END=864 /DNA_ORIENTATION=+
MKNFFVYLFVLLLVVNTCTADSFFKDGPSKNTSPKEHKQKGDRDGDDGDDDSDSIFANVDGEKQGGGGGAGNRDKGDRDDHRETTEAPLPSKHALDSHKQLKTGEPSGGGIGAGGVFGIFVGIFAVLGIAFAARKHLKKSEKEMDSQEMGHTTAPEIVHTADESEVEKDNVATDSDSGGDAEADATIHEVDIV